MAGPLGPGVGQTLSAQIASWQFATSSAPRALAPLWSASSSVLAGDARTVVDATTGAKRLYVYPSATTTGTTAPTFAGRTGTDGSQTNVIGYALGQGFGNGCNATNEDPANNIVRGGDVNAQAAAIMPNGGSRPLPVGDPSTYYVVATGSATSQVSVEGYL